MKNQHTRILIVDDALIERAKLKGFFAKRGFEMIEAQNGEEAVAQYLSEKPDLVLMDVNMPIMNGYDAISAIRALEAEMVTPIIMLTADDELDTIERAFDVGANDFFPKPINFPLLHQRIRYALRDADRERELRRITRLQDTARTLAGLAFWEIDIRNNQMRWSEDAQDLLYWLPQLPEAFDQGLKIFHPDDRQRVLHTFNDAIESGLRFELEVRSSGSRQDHLLKIVGQLEREQHLLIGAFQDVTSQRRMEQQANYLTFHDTVTGLPNRKLFNRDLEECVETLEPTASLLVVGVLEILRFAQLIETYGMEMVDQLLVRIVTQLRNHAPTDSLLGRLEGGLLAWRIRLNDQVTQEDVQSALGQWFECLNRPWLLGDRETYLTFTVGVCMAPLDTRVANELLSMANRTQRLQKPTANITLGFYSNAQDEGLLSRLRLEADLRLAVEKKQFYLVYQPQVDLSSDRIVGVEALLRWRHPQGESVPPFRFIPILEETGLIHELGDWILEEACQQQVRWQAKGYPLRMGVNLSPTQFDQVDLTAKIEAIIQLTQINPDFLELEITESLAMHNPEATIETLHKLRQLGCKIAIDDFGIGFSSLEYLLRFPLTTLKIDRAFVKDITRGRSDRAIVRALTSLCQGLGLTTIAEGVETQRQRDYIDALGATEIQGFLISQPVEAEVLLTLMRQYNLSNQTIRA